MRLRDAKAQERERGFRENRGAQLRGPQHDERCQGIRQNMAEHDSKLAGADRASGIDERLLLERERVRARDPCRIGDQRDRDRDDRVVQRRAQRRRHHQRQYQERQRLEHIDEPLGREIDPAAEISREQPERDTQHAAEESRAQSHRQRDARAIDDAAIDVAAHEVGAQWMLRARCREREARVGRDRVEAGEIAREYCGKHEGRDDRRPNGTQGIAADQEADSSPASVGQCSRLAQLSAEFEALHGLGALVRELDSWIDRHIEKVDCEIDAHHDERRHHDQALDDRVIAPADRLYQEARHHERARDRQFPVVLERFLDRLIVRVARDHEPAVRELPQDDGHLHQGQLALA